MLKFKGSQHLRQRLVYSTLSSRPIQISDIRASDQNPGLRDFEASLLRLIEKVTNGCTVEINETGTAFCCMDSSEACIPTKAWSQRAARPADLWLTQCSMAGQHINCDPACVYILAETLVRNSHSRVSEAHCALQAPRCATAQD